MPSAAGRLRRHPLVVIPAVVALLVLGWHQYSARPDPVARPMGANLLAPAPGEAELAVDWTATGDDGRGWEVGATGGARATLHRVSGVVGTTALRVDVGSYRAGAVSLSSPPVPLTPNRSYLYKAYATGPATTLLADFSYRDGHTRLVDLGDFPASRTPVTVSAAFTGGPDVTAVSIVHRLDAAGTLLVDGAYLEATPHVVVDQGVGTGRELLPNPELSAGDDGRPTGWSPYQSGWLDATQTYHQDPSGNYLQTDISGYRFGEAKWQYRPVPVSPGQYFAFSADYRSDQPVDVVAEFEGATDADRQFANVATLPAGDSWTSVTEHVEVPPGATGLLLTLVSHGDGTTALRAPSLAEATRPGSRTWDRPLVSVVFDGDWRSQYTDARPLLDRYGDRATFYVEPETLETPGHLTAAQLRVLAGSGCEIGSLGESGQDLTALPADALAGRLDRSRRALEDAGFPVTDAAAPFGRTDPQVEWYARQYYRTLRGSTPGINTRQNFDPSSLRVFAADSATSPGDLAAALDRARSSNGWLVVVYGRVVRHGGTPADVSTTALDRQLAVIRDSGIAVRPVAEALAELKHE